jgi:uncharacterized protein
VGLGKQYIIPFSGLKPGKHDFEFEVGAKFFQAFENSEVTDGKILVDVSLFRQSTMLVLDFDIRGSIAVNCDRCGVPANLPIFGKQQLVVKLGEADGTEDDMVIALPMSESSIDLSTHIFEYIQLSLPARRVACEALDDKSLCDEDVIASLEKLRGEEEKKRDERWDKLKNIKLK